MKKNYSSDVIIINKKKNLFLHFSAFCEQKKNYHWTVTKIRKENKETNQKNWKKRRKTKNCGVKISIIHSDDFSKTAKITANFV